jgi:hypothetical protein
MAQLLQADYDEMDKLSSVLINSATMIHAVKAAAAADGIAGALPGSGLDGVCTQAGQFVDGAYQRVADKFKQVCRSIYWATKTFQETDEAFAADMKKFDIQHVGGK